jgi:hypothetical protein
MRAKHIIGDFEAAKTVFTVKFSGQKIEAPAKNLEKISDYVFFKHTKHNISKEISTKYQTKYPNTAKELCYKAGFLWKMRLNLWNQFLVGSGNMSTYIHQ